MTDDSDIDLDLDDQPRRSMTQLERFLTLLDEMGVQYTVEQLTYGGEFTGGRAVVIPTSGDDTDVTFDEMGRFTTWE